MRTKRIVYLSSGREESRRIEVDRNIHKLVTDIFAVVKRR